MSGEEADSNEVISSPLYKYKEEWKDVEPIYQSNEEEGAVRIAVTDEFRDAFAYLRAVILSKELSHRVLTLTTDCIQQNPANYTLWQLRRDLLKELNVDLKSEIRFLDEITSDSPKNYQVWHHRRAIVELIGMDAAAEELDFTDTILSDESKNYHAWQHRQWVVRHFHLASDSEMSFALKLIMEDPRNNSAWNYRYFILKIRNLLLDKNILDVEINIAVRLIEKMPNNESVWNYLSGLLLGVGITERDDVIKFVEDLYERTEESKRSPYLVSFLCDILLAQVEKNTNAEENSNRAKQLYGELLVLDPVRKNYWIYQQKVAENLLQKSTFKTVPVPSH